MYTMKFYDLNGNKTDEVSGLTRAEVDTIYRGIIAAVGKQRQSLNKSTEPSSCFNLCFPTVWDEETNERVAGY